jgi:hypothetical protein
MSEATNAAVRAAMTTRALSTLGTGSPEWDNALQEVLRLEAIYLSDLGFGSNARANEAFTHAKMAIEEKYGREWKLNPEAAAASREAWKTLNQADEKQAREILRPLWDAQRQLMLTPAPTLNAALFKAELMEWAEIWNDSQLERDGFEIVAEELERFAEGGA